MHSVIRSRAWLALACSLLLGTAACGGTDDAPASPTVNVPFAQTDLAVGTGAEAVNGRRVSVNYTGWLYDPSAAENKGRQFDTSVGRGPFAFTLGRGEVIRGWDQGVAGMRVGGRRRLVIPPDLGYGAQGFPPVIPANATLLFEVELLEVS
jgi:FKBP-type peptidyl-prolyl cis-trans isomerase